MIEILAAALPIIIYFLLIILLIIGIILGIKLIITIDRINGIIEDITKKLETLNSVFKLISLARNKVGFLGSKIVDSIASFVNKIIGLGNGKEDDDYE